MFISPFVLVFSLSVILLVHGWVVPAAIPEPAVRTVTGLSLPAGLERLAGRDLVNALRPVLDVIGVKGEVDFIRAIPSEHRLVIPVHLPGRETSVNITWRPAPPTSPRAARAGAVHWYTCTKCPASTMLISASTASSCVSGNGPPMPPCT